VLSGIIQNKVAESSLKTIDLSVFIPTETPLLFDLSSFLYQGLILREKDYRESLSAINWNIYKGKTVLVYCSNDAIIPAWAYMLAASNLGKETDQLFFLTPEEWRLTELLRAIRNIDPETYRGARVVVKGCGDENIPVQAYFEITKMLTPVVKSILYGEPCSTVPVYKSKDTNV